VLKLSTEDAAKAVAENTAYMAMYCQDKEHLPIASDADYGTQAPDDGDRSGLHFAPANFLWAL
jgi:hypothetical protein